MKIWLSKNSEIPVREQLITQVTIGVLSGDLQVGDRLPSTREIARRYQIHSNTVSSAYQKLADDGWLAFKKGSGFYVREADQALLNTEMQLDRLITEFLRSAHLLGFSPGEVRSRIEGRFKPKATRKILIIESDVKLREIIAHEIGSAADTEVIGASFADFAGKMLNHRSVFAAMIDEKPKIESVLSPERDCMYLRARSVAEAMAGQRRPSPDDLIAVVSGWDRFLMMAKTMLVAANLDPASLIVRHTAEKGWKNGLKAASMIICDSLTASALPASEKIRSFQIVSDESINDVINALGA